MSTPQIEIQLIAAVVAAACALPGVFLILRGMALMSDAISHSILLGIVAAYFITHDLTSPFLVIAAAATGVLTVGLVEVLSGTKLVKEDSAIGLVFPVLFSIGVILISRYAGDVHLDTDAVLMGELAFAPFDRLVAFGMDLGPRSFWLMFAILILNALFFAVFFKELKLATFDPALAATLGFVPGAIHYALMALVSITAVGAFDAVGSILVVALMIGPPAAAYLLTDRLSTMIWLSAGIGVLCAIGGYWTAHILDASIAGSMASTIGAFFVLTFLAAPRRGIVALARMRARQRWDFAATMLVIHLLNHEDSPDAGYESRMDHLHEHIQWEPAFARSVVRHATRLAMVKKSGDLLTLTDHGRKHARSALAR